jgi:endonuclease/exonuclease/phosphatase (EEP) superfamily protein YafD
MKPHDEQTLTQLTQQLQKKVTDAMSRHNCSLGLPIITAGDFNTVPHQARQWYQFESSAVPLRDGSTVYVGF